MRSRPPNPPPPPPPTPGLRDRRKWPMYRALNKSHYCYITGNWFPTTCALIDQLRGHMTSNNETVSRQNLLASNIAQSITSEGYSALLPANVDRRPPFTTRFNEQFELQILQLYNISLKTGPSGNSQFCFPRISVFPLVPPRETLILSGNKMNCFLRDQSLSF